MKIYLLLSFAILLLLSGCSVTYMQLYHTDSTDCIKKENSYVYENDSVRIDYTFWDNSGIMSFSIYNKLSRPLFVDWTRSSLIINSKNHFYAQDTLLSESVTNQAYDYYHKNYYPTYSHTTTTRPKFIGFIPPQTVADRVMKGVMTGYIKLSGIEPSIEIKNGTLHRKTKTYERKYDLAHTPLLFRNYLSLSYDENWSTPFTVDNGFYISAVEAMDIQHFMTSYEDNTARFYFKKGTDFYLYK